MNLLPWLQAHSKQATVVATSLVTTMVSTQYALNQVRPAYEDELDPILDQFETPLERLTRRTTGSLLISLGNAFTTTQYVYPPFGQEVGKTLIKYGKVMYYSPLTVDKPTKEDKTET